MGYVHNHDMLQLRRVHRTLVQFRRSFVVDNVVSLNLEAGKSDEIERLLVEQGSPLLVEKTLR